MSIVKKTAALLLSAAVTLSVCVSCSGSDAVSRVRQNGGLRVGYSSCGASEDAPFILPGNKGLTAEPAVKTADGLDVDVSFVRVGSSDAYDLLLSGRVDCLWNAIPPEKGLVSSVRTVETGIYYRQRILTLSGSSITRLADVKGQKLAVVSGSDAQAELHNASVMESSLKEIVVCGSMQEVLQAVADGRVSCAAVDEPQALYAMASFGGEAKFTFVDTPIAECSLVIATRSEDADLCAGIAEKYVAMSRGGKISALCESLGLSSLLSSVIKGSPDAVGA